MTVEHIGAAPLHQWRELPQEWLSLLPEKVEGKLCVCRELTNGGKAGAA
jgi:hypothetical protein